MQQPVEWMYIACLALFSLFLTIRSRSSHKFLLLLVVWWLWALTLPAQENMIFPVAKNFEIQPSRLLLIFFLPYIFIQYVTRRSLGLLKIPSYENFLIAFYLTGLLCLIYHLVNGIELRDIVLTYTGWLTFAAVYIIFRQHADEGMIIGILRAFIAIAILSSIVAIIQLLILPDFLRYNFEREAFGGYLRSNGLFRDEYVHSYFCIIASYVTFFFMKNRLSKTLILATLAIGVAFSFHRMSYIIFLCTFGLSFLYFSRGKALAPKILVVGVIALAILSLNLWSGSHNTSEFTKDRLLVDTLSGRLEFFSAVIQRISNEWIFGVGSVNTKAYYYDAIISGHDYVAYGEGGGIHNLYLFLAYFYGIPVALFFTGFLITSVLFYWKCLRRCHMFYQLPTLTMLMFMLANFSNYFPPNDEVSVYVAIIIGISISVFKNNLEDKIQI